MHITDQVWIICILATVSHFTAQVLWDLFITTLHMAHRIFAAYYRSQVLTCHMLHYTLTLHCMRYPGCVFTPAVHSPYTPCRCTVTFHIAQPAFLQVGPSKLHKTHPMTPHESQLYNYIRCYTILLHMFTSLCYVLHAWWHKTICMSHLLASSGLHLYNHITYYIPELGMPHLQNCARCSIAQPCMNTLLGNIHIASPSMNPYPCNQDESAQLGWLQPPSVHICTTFIPGTPHKTLKIDEI